MTRGTRAHVRALDGLRGAAVLGVIGFHLASLDGGDRHGLLPGGWLGVDTFFTLSGYLITTLLLAEGRIDLRGFWRRRLRRLQPAALVLVTACLLTAGWWAAAGTGDAVRRQALAALAAVANWQALWDHQPYAAGASPSVFEHLWSLAVEEQFYVVWPLVVAAVVFLGGRRRSVLGLAAIGTAVSWALLAAAPLQRGYLGTDTRMGSILVGAALAAILPFDTERRARWGGPAALAGLAVTGVAWVAAGWPPNLDLQALVPLHALATAAILAGVVLAPSSASARALGWGPLAAVGRVSYGLYLWHWPVFVVLTPEQLDLGLPATNVVRLGVTAALTWLSWVLVEHPVRRDLVLRRTRVALPTAVVLAVVLATLAVHQVDPAPAWADTRDQVVARSASVPVAMTLPPQRPHRVVIVGDSIPTSLMGGDATGGGGLQVGVGHLLDQLAGVGVEAWGATITGCPVIDAVIVIGEEPWRRCLQSHEKVYPVAMAHRPDLVVWYDRQDAHPVLLDDGTLDTDPAHLEQRMRARVAWFAAQGAKVAFVSPGPNRDGHDAFAPLGSARRSMAILDRLQHVLAATDPNVVGVIRMADLLCDGRMDRCDDRLPDGSGTFRVDDGVHFDAEGARVAGQWLAEQVAALDLTRGGRPPRP